MSTSQESQTTPLADQVGAIFYPNVTVSDPNGVLLQHGKGVANSQKTQLNCGQFALGHLPQVGHQYDIKAEVGGFIVDFNNWTCVQSGPDSTFQK